MMAVLCAACTEKPATLKVATYNIRNENQWDYERGDGWDTRSPYIFGMLRYEAPDIFGCQEVLVDQLHDILNALPEYDYVGVGRDDGAEAGEYEPVFWRRDRFDLLDKGWFWLAEDPTKPALGWDAACIRICTWTHLKDKASGKKIWFFNLHMDHVGVVARAESAKLIVKNIEERCKPSEYVFVTGDFNVDQTNEIYTTFTTSEVLTDSYERAADRLAPDGTFNAFNPNNFTTSRIDHIFVSPRFKVEHYGILTNGYWTPTANSVDQSATANGPTELRVKQYRHRTPSDHYPVIAKLTY